MKSKLSSRYRWLMLAGIAGLLVGCALIPGGQQATPAVVPSQANVETTGGAANEVVATEVVATDVATTGEAATDVATTSVGATDVTTKSEAATEVATTAAPSPTPAPLRFAVIGDFGEGNQAEQDVADLVKSWNPELIITVGDNNYPSGAAETIDDRIGRFYQEFIYPYQGAFGPGAEQNRFFPTLGNHDWDTAGAQAYFDYFTLPGNERYYDFVWGPVHFFAVSADSREPDGVSRISPQAQWLQERLAASTSPWKVVYFHQPPYSSGYHGPVDWMRWPFEEWGASAVLSGHDHTYERLQVGSIPYFINGLGGGPIYYFIQIEPGSQVRYNDDYGAMLVTADETQLILQFITRRGEVIDEHVLKR